MNDYGTLNIEGSLSVNATSRDSYDRLIVGWGKISSRGFLGSMRSARGLASLVVDWCWKASHIGPSRCVMGFLMAGLLSITVLKSPNMIFGPVPVVSNSCGAASINTSVFFLLVVLFAAPCHPYKLTTINALDDPISLL